MYTCINVFMFAHTGFRCSILYEYAQYSISEYNYLVNRQFYEYICLIRKGKNVQLGSYMGGGGGVGAKFYNVMFDKDVFK